MSHRFIFNKVSFDAYRLAPHASGDIVQQQEQQQERTTELAQMRSILATHVLNFVTRFRVCPIMPFLWHNCQATTTTTSSQQQQQPAAASKTDSSSCQLKRKRSSVDVEPQHATATPVQSFSLQDAVDKRLVFAFLRRCLMFMLGLDVSNTSNTYKTKIQN